MPIDCKGLRANPLNPDPITEGKSIPEFYDDMRAFIAYQERTIARNKQHLDEAKEKLFSINLTLDDIENDSASKRNDNDNSSD